LGGKFGGIKLSMTDENDYDLIMDEYQSLDSDDSPAAHFFVDTELTQMMQSLTHHTHDENLVIQNKIILLLSLFEQKDEAVKYQSYDHLSDKEKLSLKTLLKPLL